MSRESQFTTISQEICSYDVNTEYVDKKMA